MKKSIIFLISISLITSAHSLVINEIMSNPVGDDSGREWLELYNDTDTDVDATQLTLSVKGGTFVSVIPVSGGVTLPPRGYAIIGSTVGGVTRFSQDFPSYTGPLFKSSMSLVNTGITSLELRLQGVSVSLLSSYSAAKEGSSYALIGGSYGSAVPTPGEENKSTVVEEDTPPTISQTGNQTTIPRASPPVADITLYLPTEKTVVAGAPTSFTVFSTTHAGQMIDKIEYGWAFGDGGQGVGSSTMYRFLYPGRYITQVEGTNGFIAGTAKMITRVVSPDLSMSSIQTGKYGNYIDITNPSMYDIDLSYWKLSIDGALFSFPKNTLLANGTTRFPGTALGFASTTVSSSTIIKLLFQNMDEALRVTQGSVSTSTLDKSQKTAEGKSFLQLKKIIHTEQVGGQKTALKTVTNATLINSNAPQFSRNNQKDKRLVSWIKSFFN